jgi:hypothetical protein
VRRRGSTHDVFRGAIAGVGTSSGVRVVVGRWQLSPLGSFADVMLAEPDGTRWLLAPDQQVADYVAATYRFDRVRVGPVRADVAGAGPWCWQVTAPGLDLHVEVGRRGALGRLLQLVPAALATAPAFTLLTDPVARVALRGVRTRGSAGGGRREHYGATDLHPVVAVGGTWQGSGLGGLRPVTPDPRFGFGSTPTRPSVTSLVTTVVG